MPEKEKETKLSAWRLLPMGLILGVVIFLAFWLLAYNLVTKQIVNTAIQSMEELVRHDEQSILTSLHNKWDLLEGIEESIRQRKCETVSQILDELSISSQLMDCLRLTLIADDGNSLNSNQKIEVNDSLRALCASSPEKFVCLRKNQTAEAEGRAEEIMVGVTIKPLTVAGVSYTHLVARLDASTFESELKIDSYNGRGYSSVIDMNGSYIVNMSRSHTAQDIDNFYDTLSVGTLPEDYSIERVRDLIIEQQSFSMEYTRENGEVCVVAIDPMEETDWSFITVVPRKVFEEQSLTVISIFFFLMLIILLMVGVVVTFSLRRRTRLLKLERQHREELSHALFLAEQANRAKTTFLNNMSHDIRTPMNAIIGFTSLASTHIDNKERVKDYLQKISQSSSHLLSLINDVLDMSRIESGKMNIEEKAENLSEILHNLRNIIQADIHAKRQELFIDTIDVTDEDIFCDKLRLNQVLLNILSNAVKFTAPGGTISIRLAQLTPSRPGYGKYEFRVKDNGIGIDPEFLKTIFDPFTRERNSTVSGIQGTGLGMSITKNIVDMMGGTIQVESEVGKGSEFTVTMDFRLQTTHKEIRAIRQLEGLRGLVVDDDMNACQSVAQMLRQTGMRPEWSMYGKEAIARTEEAIKLNDAFSVYIIDWLMPDMNGIETTRRIRRIAGSNAPIIILSAYDWADIEDEAREAGVTEFISKPLFPSDLRQTLLRACGELVDKKPEKPDYSSQFQGKRLLLVEDNELNREIAQEILLETGFLIETAENGQEAVDAVQGASPGWFDAILMDVQMPIMNGYEATRAIRKLTTPALAHIPIIAMTANAFEEDKQDAFAAGMDAHVGKPIDIPSLLAVLQHLLKA